MLRVMLLFCLSYSVLAVLDSAFRGTAAPGFSPRPGSVLSAIRSPLESFGEKSVGEFQ
jgi:hypothetical protein